MSAGSSTGKARGTPESLRDNVGKDRRLDEVQGDGGGGDAELYHCRLPAVDSNWTEQVPSIIVAAEEDRRGEAQLWGCATVGITWLTTHLQIHDRALSVCERSAWCHASASVTYSDRVTVSEPVGWLSFWVGANLTTDGLENSAKHFTRDEVLLSLRNIRACSILWLTQTWFGVVSKPILTH